MTPTVNILTDNEAVARTFAEWLQSWLAEHPKATIALSGGSTPKALFKLLAKAPFTEIDWSGVHLFWGDERCVPPEDEQSNYGMTQELLLQNIKIPAAQIHRIKGEADPAQEAQRYAAVLKEQLPNLHGYPVFDLVLLGMGADGHTASIFPAQMELLHSDRFCAVATHPESGQQRITITGEVINHAKNIAFLVTGASKKEKVGKIIRRVGDWQAYPAAHVQPVQGSLTWYLDTAAAEDL